MTCGEVIELRALTFSLHNFFNLRKLFTAFTPPATNNFYRAWRSPKKVLMQKSQKFCADFKYVNLKIELLQIFEKKSFSSLFLMRKPLSSDQKWFLRPYFPLIGGIFVLKSGLRFLFRALEVSIQKVRKSHFLSLKLKLLGRLSLFTSTKDSL